MGPASLFWLLLLSPIFHLTLSTELRKFVPLPLPEPNKGENWMKGKMECVERGGHLVTLHNRYDVQLIKKLINWAGAYLGLHEKKHANRSEWSNGHEMTKWTTEANITYEQKCVAIQNNEWREQPCNEAMYFMCYNASEYQLIEQKKDWCEARLYCRKHFTDLVSINNNTQNEKALRSGANRAFWIGLKHDNYEWEDGQCSTFRVIGDDRGDRKCSFSEKKKNMTLDSCINGRGIICMQGDTRITAPTDPLTWEEAYDYCKENHDGLLFIRDQNEQSEVKKWLNVTEVPGPVWLGLRQSRAFGFWFWSTIDQVVDFINWRDGPPELPLSYHCGAIEAGGKWRDVNCQTKLPALCIEHFKRSSPCS